MTTPPWVATGPAGLVSDDDVKRWFQDHGFPVPQYLTNLMSPYTEPLQGQDVTIPAGLAAAPSPVPTYTPPHAPPAGPPVPAGGPIPSFVDPYGVGPFINLEQPGGPMVPAPQTPFEPGGPLHQGERDVSLLRFLGGALDVFSAPFNYLTEALIQGAQWEPLPGVKMGGLAGPLGEMLSRAQPSSAQGLGFPAMVEAHRERPWWEQAWTGAVTDPTVLVGPGSLHMAGNLLKAAPNPPTGLLAQTLPPELTLPTKVRQAAPTPPVSPIGEPPPGLVRTEDGRLIQEPPNDVIEALRRAVATPTPTPPVAPVVEAAAEAAPVGGLPKGEPVSVTAYRGTEKARNQTGEGHQFFASTPERAADYGTPVATDLQFNNAIAATDWYDLQGKLGFTTTHSADEVLDAASQAGYDGIVLDKPFGNRDYIKLGQPTMEAATPPVAPVAEAAVDAAPPSPALAAQQRQPHPVDPNFTSAYKNPLAEVKLGSSPAPVQGGMLGVPDRTVTAESPNVLQGNMKDLQVNAPDFQSFVDDGAPDGPRMPPPGGGPAPVAGGLSRPDSFLRRVVAGRLPEERLDQRALIMHEAALNAAERQANGTVRMGNQMLAGLNIGAPVGTTRAPRPSEIPLMDDLYNALHNPSKVAAGEVRVPAGFEEMYTRLRQSMDWESLARLDFDPEMATVSDYFYRGWKPPKGMYAETANQRGRLVSTPAFQKPRVDATYQEMREAGFEPLFWNPWEQWRVARMQGERYRQQMQLVDALKSMGDELARPHAGGPIPEGWRVPEVGPAFEGKPFAVADPVTGEPVVGYTRRWMVPDRVANTLEAMYGKKPNMGKLAVGDRSVDIGKVVDWLVFVPKRAKLFGSFFQQMDFLTRTGVGSWSAMTDALLHGKPVEAVRHLAMYPKTAGEMVVANFTPSWRRSLLNQLDETGSLIKGRPGVNMREISRAGLSVSDVTILPKDMDAVVRQVAEETGLVKAGKALPRALLSLESAMRRGLFEGVYPAAILNDVRHNIAPQVARLYPDLTDEQMASRIAELANKRYSTIPASQSLVQSRLLREGLRRVFFSMGESEALLRQAAGALNPKGHTKAFWIENSIGAYLFLIATANVIHFASTGKPLPKERYTPLSKTDYGPWPIGYNTKFAAPDIPLKGRGGTRVTLDLVGQLDTAFRVLDPVGFVTSRESVPVRAATNQLRGKDFYGAPIDDVGPGGVVSRTVQLAQDMFSPIGVGQAATEVARAKVPGATEVLPEGESRLGVPGNLLQATGVNLRAETTPDLLNARAQALGAGNYKMLEPFQGLELQADRALKEELGLRRETSADQGSPFSVAAQEKASLVQKDEEKWAAYAKSRKMQSALRTLRRVPGTPMTPADKQAKADKDAIVSEWYDDRANLAARKDQTGKVLFPEDQDVRDVIQGADLATAEGRQVVWGRIEELRREDPNKAALTEYYTAFDLAKAAVRATVGLEFSDQSESVIRGKLRYTVVTPGALSSAMEMVEKNWTPEAKEYVLRNTHMTKPPEEVFKLLGAKARKDFEESEAARQRFRPVRQRQRTP